MKKQGIKTRAIDCCLTVRFINSFGHLTKQNTGERVNLSPVFFKKGEPVHENLFSQSTDL
jgi:hypothetical protein